MAKAEATLDPKKAEVFVKGFIEKIHHLMTDKSSAQPERLKQVCEILETSFDTKLLKNFEPDHYLKNNVKKESDAIVGLCETMVAISFDADHPDRSLFKNQNLKILEAHLNKEGEAVVSSELVDKAKKAHRVLWKVHTKNDKLYIYDVIIGEKSIKREMAVVPQMLKSILDHYLPKKMATNKKE